MGAMGRVAVVTGAASGMGLAIARHLAGRGNRIGLLDLHSLLKASRLLSQEVQLDALLHKLLGIVLENAGAEFGAIVLCEDDALTVEAVGRAAEILDRGLLRNRCNRLNRR